MVARDTNPNEVTSLQVQSRVLRFYEELAQVDDLTDLKQVISDNSKWDIYELIHCGVCKIGNTVVKDTIFEKPFAGSALRVSSFSDELKTAVCNEMIELMEPVSLIRHKFQSFPDDKIEPVRDAVRMSIDPDDDIFFIPGWHDGSISVCTIFGNFAAFELHRTRTLIALQACMAGIFTRFPTLITWPDEHKLTSRESEALQLSTHGLSYRQIAIEMDISANTVRNHIENAKLKYEARNKAHLIALAARSGEINAYTKLPRRSKKK